MDNIPEPIRPDHEDRYMATDKTVPWYYKMMDQLSTLRHRNLILGFAALIVVLLLSLVFFGSDKPKPAAQSEWQTLPANETVTIAQPTESENSAPDFSNQATADAQTPAAETTQPSTNLANDSAAATLNDGTVDNLEQKILSLEEPKQTQPEARVATPPTNPTQPAARTATEQATAPVSTNEGLAAGELPLNTTIAADHFTIQLSASSSKANLEDYARKFHITNYQIYLSKTAAISPWFVLIKGDFANKQAAKAVLSTLPAAMQSNSPWIKSGKTVQKEMQ